MQTQTTGFPRPTDESRSGGVQHTSPRGRRRQTESEAAADPHAFPGKPFDSCHPIRPQLQGSRTEPTQTQGPQPICKFLFLSLFRQARPRARPSSVQAQVTHATALSKYERRIPTNGTPFELPPCHQFQIHPNPAQAARESSDAGRRTCRAHGEAGAISSVAARRKGHSRDDHVPFGVSRTPLPTQRPASRSG